MTSVGRTYTSGNWHVSEGKEDEFISTWSAFVTWTLATFPGADHAFLIRQDDDPRHFLSFGEWDGRESVAQWRQHPDFSGHLGAARSLCDSFQALDYTVAAAPER